MSCYTIADIVRACTPPLGIASMRYFTSADLPELQLPSTSTQSPELPVGAIGYKIEADAGAAWRETTQRSEQGDRYDHSVTFSARALRSAVTDTFMALRHRRISLEITDENGDRYFLPSLQILVDRELSDRNNKYSVRLQGSTAAPAQQLPRLVASMPGNAWGNPTTNEVWGSPDTNEVWVW